MGLVESDITMNKLKDCGNSKNYKGIRPPRCNDGKGCDACRAVREKKLSELAELIRRS